MRGILFAAVIGFSTTLFASAGPQEQHMQSPPHEMHNMAAMDCPMKLSAADLSIEDTSDGIRLTFTTKSGDVAKVRHRVEAFFQAA
jgi:hypothetical protein